jgi:hypothetical protein
MGGARSATADLGGPVAVEVSRVMGFALLGVGALYLLRANPATASALQSALAGADIFAGVSDDMGGGVPGFLVDPVPAAPPAQLATPATFDPHAGMLEHQGTYYAPNTGPFRVGD